MTVLSRHVAILGAGIMGTCLALFLARRGLKVSLFDRESSPLASASRWNEGKIHLGYLYGADPTMRTAQLLIPGGLLFRPLISELTGLDIAPHATATDDIYLIHRQSAVDAQRMRAQFAAVSDLVRDHADASRYLTNASGARARELSQRELSTIADPAEIIAAFETPERSVNTQWVADRLMDALRSETRVLMYTGVTITGARPAGDIDGRWRVTGLPHLNEEFDLVVNALWDGRLAVDCTANLHPEPGWSHRYRLSVFARTSHPVTAPSAIIAVGPFGDVKNYNGRDFYMSWYPTGLVAEGHGISLSRPKPLSGDEERALIDEVCLNLAKLIPGVTEILAAAEDAKVRGGFVFAHGQGLLSDPSSTLHRRDRFGIRRIGNYYSVDTGKYSTAPWLAASLASAICGD